MSILVKFIQKFRFLVKIFENFDFSQMFWQISILVKFSKNFEFAQIFEEYLENVEKYRFVSNFRKIAIYFLTSNANDKSLFCSMYFDCCPLRDEN